MIKVSPTENFFIMKNRFLLIPLLTFLGGIISNWNLPVRSALTIIKCTGQVPKNNACLIDASSYKIAIYRIDLCKENPFPAYRSTPDYLGAGCISLFNRSGKLWKVNFRNYSKYKIPSFSMENIKPDTYNYSAIILKNSFKSSGKYTSGDKTWITGGVDKITKKKILIKGGGNPVEFTTKLTNWRGMKNKNNDYCINNGGTPSRCEVKYNGYEITAIGLDSDFIENYGENLNYVFYMNKLKSPMKFKKDIVGEFFINVKNQLEVYGSEGSVQSISIAPFIFDVVYDENNIY